MKNLTLYKYNKKKMECDFASENMLVVFTDNYLSRYKKQYCNRFGFNNNSVISNSPVLLKKQNFCKIKNKNLQQLRNLSKQELGLFPKTKLVLHKFLGVLKATITHKIDYIPERWLATNTLYNSTVSIFDSATVFSINNYHTYANIITSLTDLKNHALEFPQNLLVKQLYYKEYSRVFLASNFAKKNTKLTGFLNKQEFLNTIYNVPLDNIKYTEKWWIRKKYKRFKRFFYIFVKNKGTFIFNKAVILSRINNYKSDEYLHLSNYIYKNPIIAEKKRKIADIWQKNFMFLRFLKRFHRTYLSLRLKRSNIIKLSAPNKLLIPVLFNLYKKIIQKNLNKINYLIRNLKPKFFLYPILNLGIPQKKFYKKKKKIKLDKYKLVWSIWFDRLKNRKINSPKISSNFKYDYKIWLKKQKDFIFLKKNKIHKKPRLFSIKNIFFLLALNKTKLFILLTSIYSKNNLRKTIQDLQNFRKKYPLFCGYKHNKTTIRKFISLVKMMLRQEIQHYWRNQAHKHWEFLKIHRRKRFLKTKKKGIEPLS